MTDLRSQAAWWKRVLPPTLGDVLFMTIVTFSMALGGSLFHRDGDLGRHLRLGARLIEDGVLPTVDVYSHTMTGGELIPHWWISQALFAFVERLFGFDGIAVVTALAVALPWVIMYRWLVSRGTPIAAAFAVGALGAAASVIHWATRPHIFSWLFLVVWVIVLEDVRSGRRRRAWILVPLAAFWANVHAAFIVGFILLALHLVGALLDGRRDRARHLTLVLGATVGASLLNPKGAATIVNGFAYVGEDFLLDFTTEYNSPDFHSPLAWPFLAMLLLTVVAPVARSWTSRVLVVVWTAFALYSFRNIPVYALVVAPYLADAIGERSRLTPLAGRAPDRLRAYALIERSNTGGALAAAFVVLLGVSLAGSPGSSYRFSPEFFPVDALEDSGQEPPGDRVFNQFEWGGYLEYCCWPEIPVFIDGQTDLYGSALTRDYAHAIEGGPRWSRILAEHEVDWVLIRPETGLAQILAESDAWRQIYRDDVAVVFVES